MLAGEIEPLVSIFVDATFRLLDNASRLAQDLTAVREADTEQIQQLVISRAISGLRIE